MRRSDTRILTTHAGSLPRPAPLTEAFIRQSRGEPVDAPSLAKLVETSMRQVVERQRAAGIDVPNDGEQSRESFFTYVRHRLSGFGGESDRPVMRDLLRYPSFVEQKLPAFSRPMVSLMRAPSAVGPVCYLDPSVPAREVERYLGILAALNEGPIESFMTAPSPGIVASAIRNEHYASEDAYLDALAAALAHEYGAIVRAGFLLQLDCPDLALERHVSYQERPLGDFLAFVERVVATINRALADIPPECVRMHVCWGNYEAPHDCDVPLAEILPILRQAKVGALVLPFANPRHAHEVRCLKETPLGEDQLVVAGVIDSLTNFVEHPEVVAERLVRVAEAVGDPARVIAGTDCGFDTSAGMGRVAEDVVWAKLRALHDGARIASERLFGKS